MIAFFLAHAKSASTADLEQMERDARQLLEPEAGGAPFSIVLARNYYESRFKACGSWDAWIGEVVTGIDFATRAPIFRAILVPEGVTGAGTAKIVEMSLGVGKPVYGFGAGRIWPLAGLEVLNRNWKEGYAVRR